MGDLLGSPRVAPLFLFLLFFLLNLFYFRHYQRQHILHFTPHNLTGPIITALMNRILSELRSSVSLGERSTRMGDLLGSPRVAPLFLFLLFFLLNLFYCRHYQRQHILHFTPHNLTGAIIPALMHRIPSELRS